MVGSALKGRDITKPPRKNRDYSNRPDFPSLFLEWSWGWRPMIEDIFKAAEVLVSPVMGVRVKRQHWDTYREQANFQSFDDWAGGGWTHLYIVEDHWVSYRVKSWARVRVENENVALANRLGLINPVGVAWAVVPFSFVVDKFVNVGQMINSFTDLYGFQVWDAWTARTCQLGVTGTKEHKITTLPWGAGAVLHDAPGYVTAIAKGARRRAGLLGPVPSLRDASIGSWGEAVSYFALFLQLLRGK